MNENNQNIKPVRVVLRIFGKQVNVDAGYDGKFYHVGGRVLSESELRETVRKEHGIEIEAIQHD